MGVPRKHHVMEQCCDRREGRRQERIQGMLCNGTQRADKVRGARGEDLEGYHAGRHRRCAFMYACTYRKSSTSHTPLTQPRRVTGSRPIASRGGSPNGMRPYYCHHLPRNAPLLPCQARLRRSPSPPRCSQRTAPDASPCRLPPKGHRI